MHKATGESFRIILLHSKYSVKIGIYIFSISTNIHELIFLKGQKISATDLNEKIKNSYPLKLEFVDYWEILWTLS